MSVSYISFCLSRSLPCLSLPPSSLPPSCEPTLWPAGMVLEGSSEALCPPPSLELRPSCNKSQPSPPLGSCSTPHDGLFPGDKEPVKYGELIVLGWVTCPSVCVCVGGWVFLCVFAYVSSTVVNMYNSCPYHSSHPRLCYTRHALKKRYLYGLISLSGCVYTLKLSLSVRRNPPSYLLYKAKKTSPCSS